MIEDERGLVRYFELGIGVIEWVCGPQSITECGRAELAPKLARKLGVHRRMVRQALANAIAIPPERKAGTRPRPKLGGVAERVWAMPMADLSAHRKQRQTAHRIWVRLREEAGCTAAEITVRQLLGPLRREIGAQTRET